MVAADGVLHLAQIGSDLLALHHHGAPLGERGLLAILRRERFQFVGGVAQVIRLTGGAFHAGPVLIERGRRPPPRVPKLLQRPTSFSRPENASSRRRWVAASTRARSS